MVETSPPPLAALAALKAARVRTAEKAATGSRCHGMNGSERARRVNPSVELWETEEEHVRTMKLDGEPYLLRALGLTDENLGARSV